MIAGPVADVVPAGAGRAVDRLRQRRRHRVLIDAVDVGGRCRSVAGHVGDGDAGVRLAGAVAERERCRGGHAGGGIGGHVGDDRRSGADVVPAGAGRAVQTLAQQRQHGIEREAQMVTGLLFPATSVCRKSTVSLLTAVKLVVQVVPPLTEYSTVALVSRSPLTSRPS